MKKPKWDGRSRVSNDLYRKRWNEIFGGTQVLNLDKSFKSKDYNGKEKNEKENNKS
tara:strand:- start:9 stop:176 length:168 start_codon:yes stop_codon:yes gene_type:complete